MELLFSTIEEYIFLTDALKERICQVFNKQQVKKNKLLLKENQYCKHFWFLSKGAVRSYYNHEGKEVTSWIYLEKTFFSSWYSFLNSEKSYEYLEVLEDSEVISISFEDLQKIYVDFPAFEKFGRLLYEGQLSYIDWFSKGYLFLTAKERYQLIVESFPGIEQKVKLGYIASFLGISQETLSRIRSK